MKDNKAKIIKILKKHEVLCEDDFSKAIFEKALDSKDYTKWINVYEQIAEEILLVIGTKINKGQNIKLFATCNHCFMVALKRKYGYCEGKKIWWLECPSCKRKY